MSVKKYHEWSIFIFLVLLCLSVFMGLYLLIFQSLLGDVDLPNRTFLGCMGLLVTVIGSVMFRRFIAVWKTKLQVDEQGVSILKQDAVVKRIFWSDLTSVRECDLLGSPAFSEIELLSKDGVKINIIFTREQDDADENRDKIIDGFIRNSTISNSPFALEARRIDVIGKAWLLIPAALGLVYSIDPYVDLNFGGRSAGVMGFMTLVFVVVIWISKYHKYIRIKFSKDNISCYRIFGRQINIPWTNVAEVVKPPLWLETNNCVEIVTKSGESYEISNPVDSSNRLGLYLLFQKYFIQFGKE